MRILAVNAGSSSLKLAAVEDADRVTFERRHAALEGEDLERALELAIAETGPIEAIGHRVVHDGGRFAGAVQITGAALDELHRASDLAPLHNPPALAAIEALRLLQPDLPAVACFDTAFHSTLPAEAATYALPRAWSERWPLRRFGFHGLSHSWVARRVPELAGQPVPRLVSCHLGAGASLTAIADGRSVDTTMGFTPLEGLVMATRSGSLDPGLLLWVQRQGGIAPEDAERALEHEAGLLGLSGRSGDMRELIEAADSGDEEARLALGVYIHRLRGAIAAMAGALGGIDAIAFTGGVGEASARVRADASAGLGFMGIALDPGANRAADGDSLISDANAPVVAAVVRAREELEIARQTTGVLLST